MSPSSDWSRQTQKLLQKNLEQIRQRIERACESCNRSPEEVKLVAVTKYTPIEIVSLLLDLPQTILGENRPQQLVDRAKRLANQFSWHLIGQLQRNKVRSVLPYASCIHSIDSLRLLQHVDRIAGELKLRPSILLQVNISNEHSKSGFSELEIREKWPEIIHNQNVEIRGLMTMAAQTSDEGLLRSTFRGLKELKNDLNSLGDAVHLTELSMGMSSDFEAAIKEGATYIRVGSSLFKGCEAAE